MKIEKILEVRLDINDTNHMFNMNYDKIFLEMLKERYNKRCYKSMLILDILKIIKRSNIYCKNKVLDGTMYVDIQFIASGIIYEKGEVIHNCKIIQIHSNGIMHSKSEYAAIQISNIEGINVFKENEYIPIIVNRVKYNLFDNEITVLALPLIPLEKEIILYKSNKPYTTINDNISNSLHELSLILKDIEKYKKEYKDSYEFFINLLYPYKKEKSIKSNKLKIDANMFKNLDNVVVTSSYTFMLDDFIYTSDLSKKSILGEVPVVDLSSDELILRILYDYKKNLISFKEFIENYNTKDKIKEKSHVWSIYNMLKK